MGAAQCHVGTQDGFKNLMYMNNERNCTCMSRVSPFFQRSPAGPFTRVGREKHETFEKFEDAHFFAARKRVRVRGIMV